MASCDFCKRTILFGGSSQGNVRFCNDDCRNKSNLLKEASRLPAEWVRNQTQAVHSGSCPNCGGPGPVDFHTAHRVWSAVFLTTWSSHPAISCRKCALKSQAASMLYCLALGWWGLPWGLVWTPVQIVRNVIGMVNPPSPEAPSPDLEREVAFKLAAQQLQQRPEAGIPPRLPPLPPVLPGHS